MKRTMGVPLYVESIIGEDGNQKLEIWSNGICKIANPPFKPYIVSKVPLDFSGDVRPEFVKTTGFPISSLRETELWRYAFNNTAMINNFNRSLEKESREKRLLIADNHTEFREKILYDTPDHFRQYAQTEPLKVFCFDLETLMLNRKDFVSIISAAWGMEDLPECSETAVVYWKGKNGEIPEFETVDAYVSHLMSNPDFIDGEDRKLYDENRKVWRDKRIAKQFSKLIPYVNKADEIRVINALLNAIVDLNPDILIGYNHKSFDFVRLFDRCKALKIDYRKIARGSSGVRVEKKRGARFDDERNVFISGRLVYDILESARADQSLSIKRKGLKDVAEFLKIETVREDTSNTALIPYQELKDYNEHDVWTTFKLYNVYILNHITLSEMFGTPLNMRIDGSPSFLANVFQAPALHKLGIVSDGMNRERHPEIYERTLAKESEDDGEDEDDDDSGDKDKDKAVYEAAYVDIYQTGYFPKIRKVDYKGMYNAIEITANISPETTKIVKYIDYDEDGFKYEKHGSFILYYVPDKRINKTVVIAVNNAFDGVLKIKLKEIREKRFEIKQAMKTCTEEERAILESQQVGLKVVANIPSGYNGQATARWGDIAVSILTVGIGRLLIRDTIRYIEAKYGNHTITDTNLKRTDRSKFKVCVEVDTDGIYVCEDIDVKDLNHYLENRVKELLGVEESEMQLDFEKFGAGYFIKMKTYILQELDEHNEASEHFTIHGGGLKGSKVPPCFDITLNRLIKCILSGKGDIKKEINECLDIKRYSIKELSLGLTLNKEPNTYLEGSQQAKLIRQSEAIGEPARLGTQFDYVKSRDGYTFSHLIQSIDEIDCRYYEATLIRLMEKLGLTEQLRAKDTDSVDEWA